MAVEKVEHLESVLVDMNAHTVTVTFDDEKTELAAIEAALNDAGFTVTDEKKLD